MLRLTNAGIGYGNHTILADSSLQLAPGEVVGLVAPNGFGKTTLMRVLAGNRRRMLSGYLSLNDISPYDTKNYARDVYLSHADNSLLYRNMSGRYHLEVVKELWDSTAEIDDTAKLTQIDGFIDLPTSKLSQGMGRLLALAMALESRAKYVLLDEPLNALDPTRTDMAEDIMRNMASQGTGVLVASHNSEALDKVCGRYIFFKDTRLVSVNKRASCRELYYEFYEQTLQERGGLHLQSS